MVPKTSLAAAADPSRLGVLQASDQTNPGPARAPELTGRAPPARLSDGDRAGLDFEDVYERHFDFVWRSLRLLGVPPEAVEDATQDTFSVVSRRLARFEGRSSLRTWLFAILQRVVANHARMGRRKLQAQAAIR